jgi:hypothetical protein
MIHDAFVAAPSEPWTWQDPFGDCSWELQNGLVIRAANGRDLGDINLSAPRLLRPAGGDEFAAEAVCSPVPKRPAIGGLLLWKDPENILRLERGAAGPHEIWFRGRFGNEDVELGRGRLPSERIVLRLERTGGRVIALCSAEGQSWFTLGHTGFPVEDPVQVGLYAIGRFDRLVYPGAHPEGTAIRFEQFSLWQ